jgi:DNA repair exonuclease SbcCD ATPase subunit
LRLLLLRITRDPIMARKVKQQEDDLRAMSVAIKKLEKRAILEQEVKFDELRGLISGIDERAQEISQNQTRDSSDLQGLITGLNERAAQISQQQGRDTDYLQGLIVGLDERVQKSSQKQISDLEKTLAAIKDDIAYLKEPVLATVAIHEAEIGQKGELQTLRQKLSALQTRVDVLSVALSEVRADAAELKRGGKLKTRA